MSDLRQAAQMALEALERVTTGIVRPQDQSHLRVPLVAVDHAQGAIDALRAALAAAQEPVAWLWQHSETGRTRVIMPDQVADHDASWFLVGPLVLGTASQAAQSAAQPLPVGRVFVDDGAAQQPVAWMNDEGDFELSHKQWMSSVWQPLYTHPAPAAQPAPAGRFVPAGHVQIPETADEARAMAAAGVEWLKLHAPHLLSAAPPAPAAQPLPQSDVDAIINASREADEGPTDLVRRAERAHGIGGTKP